MSQWGDIGGRIRAAIAVVAVWALIFAIPASSAAAVGAADAALKNSAPASAGLFACFKRHVAHRADAAKDVAVNDKAPKSNHTGKHRCPCCLAAGGAAAVLPERLATFSRPLRASKPVFYRAAASFAPKNFSSRSINGARAPPALI